MDLFNLNTWEQQWGAFVSAPYIIGPLILGAFLAGLWFRGKTSQGQIDALNERLRLAADRAAIANEARNEVEKKFDAYKADTGNSELAAQVATAIEKLSAANNAVNSAVGITGVSAVASAGTVGIRIDKDS